MAFRDLFVPKRDVYNWGMHLLYKGDYAGARKEFDLLRKNIQAMKVDVKAELAYIERAEAKFNDALEEIDKKRQQSAISALAEGTNQLVNAIERHETFIPREHIKPLKSAFNDFQRRGYE